MNIISIKFFLFVFMLLILYYIFPKKIRWIILLFGSIVFYYLSSHKLIIFIILSIISIYFVGLILTNINKKIKLLDKTQKEEKKKLNNKKRIILVSCIILNILFIVLTKYYNFTLSNLNLILSLFKIELSIKSKLLLPLGISYYTLEAISYMVDIYRGKYEGEKNILKVALYLMYFPNITEGPISRFNELSKEFYENNKLDFNNIFIGMDLILIGLFKKMVIADRAGIFVNSVFGNNYGGFTIFVAIILYTLQIYAEFGGCIDIVRGISYLFGVKLPLNFKRPFFSKDVQEFWRRWHMSLGAWIKEYVFYPISLSKLNTKVVLFAKKHTNDYFFRFISAAFPLLFVWIVNGIWHGASYKYIVYGMYYYVFMMIGLLLEPLFSSIREKLKLSNTLVDIIHIFRTIIIVLFGMALFRSSSLSEYGLLLSNLFKKSSGLLNLGLFRIDFIILVISSFFLFLFGLLEEYKKIDFENNFTKNVFVRSIFYTLIISSIIIFGIYGEGYNAADFIYGAF